MIHKVGAQGAQVLLPEIENLNGSTAQHLPVEFQKTMGADRRQFLAESGGRVVVGLSPAEQTEASA